MYLNIRPVRYSARIASVANARRQQLRTARQLRTAQSPKERDARLQQLRPAREQTIAPESTEERQTRLQQLETNPSSTAKKCSATEDCCRNPGGDRGPSSTVKDCSATGLLSNRIAAESTEGREARLKQLKTAKHFQVYMSVRSVSVANARRHNLELLVNLEPLSHRRKETPVFNNLELLVNRRLRQNRRKRDKPVFNS